MRHPRPAGAETGPLLFVLGLVVGLLCALVTERLTTNLADHDIELVRAVRNLALEDFVGDVSSEELIDDALRGMLSGLDEYSRFYGPEEVAQISRETSGEFYGIGVVFQDPSIGRVLFAFPDSPAARAGLTVGDRFIEVDGHEIDGLEPGGLQRILQRRDRSQVKAVVEDLAGERREVVLHPEQVLDPTVRHTRILVPEHGIGYLSIQSFSHRTPGEFDQAVAELEELGMRRLVVDLRHNLGGILDAAVLIANRFVGNGTLVATRTRTETETMVADPGEARLEGLPLVLLTDEGSASASEVLAGALQDHGVAALVGERTYGKGTVQTLRPFPDERGIVKLTTATYYTPSRRAIERIEDTQAPSGIAPDFLVELTEDERRQIYAYLATYSPPHTVRPEIERWESTAEEQYLTRPPADRQLSAAVALLSGERVVPSERDANRAY